MAKKASTKKAATKTTAKKAAEKTTVEKIDVTETVEKAEVKEPAKKTEVKEAAEKAEVTEAVEKVEVKEPAKKVAKKTEAKEPAKKATAKKASKEVIIKADINGESKKASDNFKVYENENGPKISTVTRDVIEKDKMYFKDIDGTGKISKVNDWRIPAAERAAEYVKLLSTEEKIGQLFISDWRMGKYVKPLEANSKGEKSEPK